MLLPCGKNGLTSIFKEFRVFKAPPNSILPHSILFPETPSFLDLSTALFRRGKAAFTARGVGRGPESVATQKKKGARRFISPNSVGEEKVNEVLFFFRV